MAITFTRFAVLDMSSVAKVSLFSRSQVVYRCRSIANPLHVAIVRVLWRVFRRTILLFGGLMHRV